MGGEHFDVCVFGGGPAGCTIAKKLVQFGYSVMLVEKETFPRFNIGLSLSPGVHHWLQLLNVNEQVNDAGFTGAVKTRILWESQRIIEKEYGASETGYHVDRGHFDQILLQSAIKDGVQLFQPSTLKKLDRNKNGEWEIVLENQSIAKRFSTHFVVEATGRKSLFKGSKKAWLPQTLALYAWWQISSKEKACSFVEAGRNHWYWGAPVRNHGYLACVFTDPEDIRKYNSFKEFYLSKINDSVQFSSFGKPFKTGDISVCSATAYRDHHVVSENHIKVGDSAFSLDPLSAQGVQKAIKSAYQGAIVINTIMSRPENTQSALQYYKELINKEVAKNTRWTKSFYNRQNIFIGGKFWKLRQDHALHKTPENTERHISLNKMDRLILNPDATFGPSPVVGDSYIENAKAIYLKNQDEPFVFLQNTALVPLIIAMDKKSIKEGIAIIKTCFPHTEPMSILRWMVYNKLLCAEEYLI